MELKRIRTQKGLSQAEVASGIDVSATVYARYERGERKPSIEMLLRLSQFFDAPVDYLLGNKDTALSSFTWHHGQLMNAQERMPSIYCFPTLQGRNKHSAHKAYRKAYSF